MSKFWNGERGVRLQHHLLTGELTIHEIADVFGVDRSNVRRAIKSLNLITEPFPPSFTRKQRHLGLQLVKNNIDIDYKLPTPSFCERCGRRMTYNIYGDEDNNATAFVSGDNTYEVRCKECKLD
jgi:hypothetical protein